MKGGARDQAALLPLAPGVYRFRDASGKSSLPGPCHQPAQQGRLLLGRPAATGPHLSRMVARVARVEAVACDSVHEAAWLERNLLQARKPPWNRAPSGGQEVEVWIRLSDDAARPGVAVVHERNQRNASDRHFGPYLGGRQVRLAVSGLCRVLPLNYAGDDLTGTRQDMARVRGVDAADRATLADSGGQSSAATRRRWPACGQASSSAATPPRRPRLRAGGQAAAGDRGPRLGDRRAEGHQAGPGRLRRLRLVARHPGPLRRQNGSPDRLDPARLRSVDGPPPPGATPPDWAPFAQRNAELAARLTGGDRQTLGCFGHRPARRLLPWRRTDDH